VDVIIMIIIGLVLPQEFNKVLRSIPDNFVNIYQLRIEIIDYRIMRLNIKTEGTTANKWFVIAMQTRKESPTVNVSFSV